MGLSSCPQLISPPVTMMSARPEKRKAAADDAASLASQKVVDHAHATKSESDGDISATDGAERGSDESTAGDGAESDDISDCGDESGGSDGSESGDCDGTEHSGGGCATGDEDAFVMATAAAFEHAFGLLDAVVTQQCGTHAGATRVAHCLQAVLERGATASQAVDGAKKALKWAPKFAARGLPAPACSSCVLAERLTVLHRESMVCLIVARASLQSK